MRQPIVGRSAIGLGVAALVVGSILASACSDPTTPDPTIPDSSVAESTAPDPTVPESTVPAGSSSAWELDEDPGSTVLVDADGDRDGTIGESVELTGDSRHRWSTVAPDDSPYDPGRVHLVEDHPDLDPGDERTVVLVRLRTDSSKGNIVQKGQSGTSGGFFKMEMDDGRVACQFRGSDGSVFVRSDERIDDGAWHDVLCERDGDTVTLVVDGSVAERTDGTTSTISNEMPFAIGGKSSCDQDSVGCDYFSGELGRVVLAKGERAGGLVPPEATS